MQWLVDNVTCNKDTLLSWRSSCVMFVSLSSSLADSGADCEYLSLVEIVNIQFVSLPSGVNPL